MLERIEDLALFGGTPKFKKVLHVGAPNIGSRDAFIEKIDDILTRRWLSNNGHYVQEFEKRISSYLGVRNCIAMCNATIALEIAIRALGLSKEVIVPSFTFVATAHALRWQEITPVFCDINPSTHTIDIEQISQLITKNTTGIIGVHLWGRPCEIEQLPELAAEKNIKLMFDAAHAFGCSYRGKMIGGFGALEVISFHATKFINSAEGGAIVTNDDSLARKIRFMKNFGFSDYDRVDHLGTNAKMNELSAAMGLTSLDELEKFKEVNRLNYLSYKKYLGTVEGITLLTYNETETCNYQYIVGIIDQKAAGISRDFLQKILHAENVLTRRYFYPGCHRMEPYRSTSSNRSVPLPTTEALGDCVLCFPTGTSVKEQDIRIISDLIKFVFSHSHRVTEYFQKITN